MGRFTDVLDVELKLLQEVIKCQLVMQRILRIKQRRSISRAAVIDSTTTREMLRYALHDVLETF